VTRHPRLLTGSCHCAANRYRLEWPAGIRALPARRCGCTFCTRFNGTWTSHPEAGLEIRESAEFPLTRYRFGTATADFLFCSRCGVALAVLCEIAERTYAVVNVNTLNARDEIDFERSDSEFDGESRDRRLERRAQRWIGRVRVNSATGAAG
jgi:hypothetical protein